MKARRFEIIEFTGYGCDTVATASTWNRAVKAAISVNGGAWKKAVLKAYEGCVYLLSHTRRTFEELPEDINKHGMLGGVSVENNTRENWEYYNGVETYANGVLVTISLDPETVAAVHSRTTSAATRARRAAASTPAMAEASAPAENPYMLPNYTQRQYTGFAGYHSSHNTPMNTPTNGYTGYRIGVELETEFTTGAAREQFTDTPRNWFFCESDGSLRRPSLLDSKTVCNMKQTLKTTAAIIGMIAACALFWLALIAIMLIADAEGIQL